MKINFKWIGGATFIITIDNIKIAVDPVLCKKGTIQDYFWFKSKRLEDPVYTENDFKNCNLWLITHNHDDHLDKLGLGIIENNAKIITNKNSLKKLQSKNLSNITVLNWREKTQYKNGKYTIEIEAIPAIHGINPLSALFAGKVNGYLLTITNKLETKHIYITSDTVFKQKVIQVVKNKKIDLLIPNMGAAKQGSWIMTLTLNAKMLHKIAEILQPKLIIPVHFSTFEHYVEPISATKKYAIKNIEILKVGESKNFTL